jgi:hypothetical protein
MYRGTCVLHDGRKNVGQTSFGLVPDCFFNQFEVNGGVVVLGI